MAKRGVSLLGLAVLLGAVSPCARAGTIDSLYVFGDSLSDAGNVHALTGIPGAPYYNGEFSNGPVWAADLAADLGLPALLPSVLGGTDYAYGTAETGGASFDTSNPITDLLGPTGQLAQYQATHPTADPNGLYVIWLGSNDLSDIPAGSTPLQVAIDLGTIAGNIDSAIGTLASEGADNFLVVTVPDLGKTPAAIAGGAAAVAGASTLSAAFDTTLVNGSGPVPSLASLAAANSLNLKVLNTYSLVDSIAATPAPYGFTDVTDPCFNGITVCANPSQYLFWDTQHPTAAGQELVADAALAEIAPTPEPSSITLVGVGLIGALILVRRRAKTMLPARASR